MTGACAWPAFAASLVTALMPTATAERAAPVLAPWKDWRLSAEKRVDDLLNRLTDEEVISQLSNSAGPFLDQNRSYEFGQECLAGFDGQGLW
eukprot:gene14408-20584_t